MNIGYLEAMKDDVYDCVVFHDVDLLPEDDRLLYSCIDTPKHLSVAIDKYGYRLVIGQQLSYQRTSVYRVLFDPKIHLGRMYRNSSIGMLQ